MLTLVQFPHSASHFDTHVTLEDRIARLADASYQVALQNGLSGSFIETQLDIWSAVRQVVEAETAPLTIPPTSRTIGAIPSRIAGVG